MERTVHDYSHEVEAAAAEVFPLLCPIKEYDWIPGWTCELIYSDSGVAEDNCVFTTGYMGVPMVWTCTRYEPSRRIEYVAVAPECCVMRLNIRLEPAGDRTVVHWQRIFTSLSENGKAIMSHWNRAAEERVGEMLRSYFAHCSST